MEPKFSIITANYNGFQLMDKYFRSLEEQSYNNFEVIIIDDCSTDDSYKNLLDYTKKSKMNIKVYKTKKNSGPGIARNIGIEKSKGEYITFIDNDDWVESKLLEKINAILEKKKYDCIIYNYYIDNYKGQIKKTSVYNATGNILSKNYALKYVRNHTVCKVYNSKIFKNKNVRFPAIRRHEDIAFVGTALLNCESFYYLDEYLYHYIQYKDSLSSNKKMDEQSLIEAFEILKKNFNGKYQDELKNKSVTDLLYGCVLIMCKNSSSRKKIIDFINKYDSEYNQWYETEIINYVGKSKKIFLNLIKNRNILLLKVLAIIHSIILK